MKKQLLLVAMIMISAISLGQKKELKKAEKAIKSGDFKEALSFLDSAESLLGGDEAQTILFHLLKGEALSGTADGDFTKMKMAATSISKAVEMAGGNLPKAASLAGALRVDLVNSAIKDQNSKDFGLASEKLYTSYMMTKTDTIDLYYAAGAAYNAKEFDTAISYYKNLIDLGFTDKKTELIATEKETGQVKVFPSKAERDLLVRSGDYIKPDVKKTDSKRGDIFRTLALILVGQDKKEEAINLIQNAKKENPNDIELVKVDASLAFEMGDMDRYNKLMQDVVKSDPKNPQLYFNLGVAASNNKQVDQALKYYEKSIELDPNYTDALINLGVLKLSKEKDIIDEMNGLGTSRADNERYDALKEDRKQMYRDAVPYLERALASSENPNVELMKSLVNIYTQIGEDAKSKALKAKVDALEN